MRVLRVRASSMSSASFASSASAVSSASSAALRGLLHRQDISSLPQVCFSFVSSQVWGDYLKHNCFKSWFSLRLHLEFNEGSKEVGMKIRTVHNCFKSLSLFGIERI